MTWTKVGNLRGPQGNQGSQGVSGTAGSQGTQGAQGTQGNVGAQGNQGAVGSQGTAGSNGAQGATGSQGNQGTAGPQGNQGSQGNQGFQGAQGNQGSTGAQGNQGSQGTQGNQGNQGAQGSTTDPIGLGMVWTVDPRYASTNGVSNFAGRGYYMRAVGSASISSLIIDVAVSSGNICLAVYANSGTGRSAVPGARKATSGSVACPAVGAATVSLGATITVNHGDWIGFAADNTTASFRKSISSPSLIRLGLAQALAIIDTTNTFPLPSTPTVSANGDLGACFCVVGA